MTRRHISLVAAVVAVLVSTTTARAVCVQNSASQAERDLWDTHGCWREFYLWEYSAYDLSDSDWGNRGWNDSCNGNFEWPKHWNAAYLIAYGLADNNDQSFHGTEDYEGAARAVGNKYKDSIYQTPTDDTSIFGSWNYHLIGSNEVKTSCLLYTPRFPNANPASRGGDFEHEAWHGWMNKYGWNNGSVGGHRPMQGNCTVNGCDYFYFHGIGAYAFGAMWQNDGTANRFHSPNQVQVEYLCDVADQPQPWVPNSVRLAAQSDANTRASQRFINGPGYSCGSPRPW